MLEEQKELKFPKDFTECPNCKSTKLIAAEVLRMEREKGKISPHITNAFLFQHQSAVLDPSRTVLSAPIILTFFDACAKCGTVICVHADVKTGVPGVKPTT